MQNRQIIDQEWKDMTLGDEDLATEFRCYEPKRSQYYAEAGGIQTMYTIKIVSVPLRPAWGCSAPEKLIFRRNTKTMLLCLHVNKSPKYSIALQPQRLKTLYLILPIKGPFGLMRIHCTSRGVPSSLCNCPNSTGKLTYLKTPLPITLLPYLLYTIYPKLSI
jgi:hypothetical protein